MGTALPRMRLGVLPTQSKVVYLQGDVAALAKCPKLVLGSQLEMPRSAEHSRFRLRASAKAKVSGT